MMSEVVVSGQAGSLANEAEENFPLPMRSGQYMRYTAAMTIPILFDDHRRHKIISES